MLSIMAPHTKANRWGVRAIVQARVPLGRSELALQLSPSFALRNRLSVFAPYAGDPAASTFGLFRPRLPCRISVATSMPAHTGQP